jgi:tRNA pseudouridine38-40 synthase
MRLAFRVSYLGDNFSGSQMQPDRRTVEGEFIAACERLRLFDDWRTAAFASSGRTDAGVHARSQILSFTTEHPKRAISALNRHLPSDCWCTGWAEVSGDFHPRYAAKTRTYRYFFPDSALDIGMMRETAAKFVGRHDFSSFARIEERSPTRRILTADVFQEDPFIVFEVTGESFLWNMVRCMASALMQAGRSELAPNDVSRMLSRCDGNRFSAAPSQGLVLWDIDCGIAFQEMEMNRKRKDALVNRFNTLLLQKKVLKELGRNRIDLGGEKAVDDKLGDIV